MTTRSRPWVALLLATATSLAAACASSTGDATASSAVGGASASTSSPAGVATSPAAGPTDTSSATLGTSSASSSPRDTGPTTSAAGWDVIGTTVRGRPIRSLTVGHGPRTVLFVGGIHGDEAEGAYATAELAGAFTAAGLADAVTLTIIEDANPDGRAAATRGNANGVDINRNFPASNFDTTNPSYGRSPLSQPESRALHDTIERVDPDLVLVAHSWPDRAFVNYDGPARALAERFAAASGLPVEESSEIAPTPGSLGSYVGRDRGTPILTIELRKGSDPQADWERIRGAVLAAIAG
ncbi:MAG: M14 family zinc carboxypeptidase [Acidimicrobiales bacterium]